MVNDYCLFDFNEKSRQHLRIQYMCACVCVWHPICSFPIQIVVRYSNVTKHEAAAYTLAHTHIHRLVSGILSNTTTWLLSTRSSSKTKEQSDDSHMSLRCLQRVKEKRFAVRGAFEQVNGDKCLFM